MGYLPFKESEPKSATRIGQHAQQDLVWQDRSIHWPDDLLPVGCKPQFAQAGVRTDPRPLQGIGDQAVDLRSRQSVIRAKIVQSVVTPDVNAFTVGGDPQIAQGIGKVGDPLLRGSLLRFPEGQPGPVIQPTGDPSIGIANPNSPFRIFEQGRYRDPRPQGIGSWPLLENLPVVGKQTIRRAQPDQAILRLDDPPGFDPVIRIGEVMGCPSRGLGPPRAKPNQQQMGQGNNPEENRSGWQEGDAHLTCGS